MANGKVITGFSRPWVAKYAASGGQVSYSGGMPLARGVSVGLDVEGSSDNDYYADNGLAESGDASFSSGTVNLTVDGLKKAARKLISGVTTTRAVEVGEDATVSFDVYDDDQKVPYVGIGFVVEYTEEGVKTYAPFILPKVKFSSESLDAATRERDIDFQSQELEATIYRADNAKHEWKLLGEDQTTEEEAYAAIKAVLTPAA